MRCIKKGTWSEKSVVTGRYLSRDRVDEKEFWGKQHLRWGSRKGKSPEAGNSLVHFTTEKRKPCDQNIVNWKRGVYWGIKKLETL